MKILKRRERILHVQIVGSSSWHLLELLVLKDHLRIPFSFSSPSVAQQHCFKWLVDGEKKNTSVVLCDGIYTLGWALFGKAILGSIWKKRENDDAFSISSFLSLFFCSIRYKKRKYIYKRHLLTFLPSNSWGPFVSTLSTLEGSANVTNPKPLSIRERNRDRKEERERKNWKWGGGCCLGLEELTGKK